MPERRVRPARFCRGVMTMDEEHRPSLIRLGVPQHTPVFLVPVSRHIQAASNWSEPMRHSG